ncbi:MAG: hypothetical protein ABFC88_13140 [Thermoguttaceae bacterium]
MNTATETTPDLVVIRVWRGDDNDIFALFPELSASYNGYDVTCYQHIGQHSAADYCGCIRQSRPATPEEAAPLLEELRHIGYNPRVIKRAPYAMHRKRIDEMRKANHELMAKSAG